MTIDTENIHLLATRETSPSIFGAFDASRAERGRFIDWVAEVCSAWEVQKPDGYRTLTTDGMSTEVRVTGLALYYADRNIAAGVAEHLKAGNPAKDRCGKWYVRLPKRSPKQKQAAEMARLRRLKGSDHTRDVWAFLTRVLSSDLNRSMESLGHPGLMTRGDECLFLCAANQPKWTAALEAAGARRISAREAFNFAELVEAA